MNPVEIRDVTAGYNIPAGADPQLRDVSLRLHQAELCAVLGPNGAGKSTLVRLMAGLLPPVRGQVLIFGDSASELDRRELARQIAVVAQRSEVALGFAVREVVAMGRAPHQGVLLRRSRQDEQAVTSALATCDLAALAERPVAELSGGEQKRVHIARALAQGAPILLLDEAAAHLDIRYSIALYQLIRAEVTARRLACLAVMHDLNAAAQYADRVVLLKGGRIVADGTVAEVMTADLLRATFEVDIEVGTSADGRRYFLPSTTSSKSHG